MEEERNWDPKPFRFLDAWLLHPNFDKLVKDFWSSTEIQRWAGYILLRKMQGLKHIIKEWNINAFGNINTDIKKMEEELLRLDICQESRDLTAEEKKCPTCTDFKMALYLGI